MWVRLRLFNLVAWLFVTSLTGSANAHTDEADASAEVAELSAAQQAVVAVLDAYALAYAAGDLEGVRELVVSDGNFSYFEGAAADRSWEDFAQHAGAEMPSFSEASYAFSNVDVELGEPLAFATFDWAMDVVVLSEQFEGGRHPVSMRGLGTAVLAMEKTGWKLRHIQTAQGKAKALAQH